MSELSIRLADPADVGAIARCAEAAYRPYVTRIGRPPAPMVADFASLVERKTVHVALDRSGAVQGFVVFYPRDDHVHLENVAVAPDHRGKGLGRRLIAFCETAARETGYSAVELYTNEKMTENLGLYPALGYVETERRHEDGFDRVYFRKTLG